MCLKIVSLNKQNIHIMNVQTEINWIVSEVLKVRDPEFIKALKSMLKYREKHVEKDWWNEISKEEKSEIEQGIKDIETGDFVSHNEAMTNARKWL